MKQLQSMSLELKHACCNTCLVMLGSVLVASESYHHPEVDRIWDIRNTLGILSKIIFYLLQDGCTTKRLRSPPKIAKALHVSYGQYYWLAKKTWNQYSIGTLTGLIKQSLYRILCPALIWLYYP